VALLGIGCGGSQTPVEVPASFPPAALTTVDSIAGQAHIEVRSWPQPPVRGGNSVQLAISDGSGAPIDGLTVGVVPWMPSHGHGTSVQPAITDDGSGVFVASPIYLYMAGQWELRIAIDGAIHDTATAIVDIP